MAHQEVTFVASGTWEPLSPKQMQKCLKIKPGDHGQVLDTDATGWSEVTMERPDRKGWVPSKCIETRQVHPHKSPPKEGTQSSSQKPSSPSGPPSPTNPNQSPAGNMSSMASGSPTKLPFRNADPSPTRDPRQPSPAKIQSSPQDPYPSPSRDPKLIHFSDVQKGKVAKMINNPVWPHELANDLSNMKIGKPATFRGNLRDEELHKDTVFDSFNIHTMPDVTKRTRIIAVLGITDDEANPRTSGWFLSDFFAFWNLMRESTDIQHWFHCVDLDSLVQKYTRYLHGNPYKERKVVLDQRILQEAKKSKHCPIYSHPISLRSAVQSAIKKESIAAEKAGENVLVLMFGHGDRDTVGMHLGGSKQLFTKKKMQYALKHLTTPVTLITTQCWGGGWTCIPDLNISGMTAAGTNARSKSWRKSGSCGRTCGSMFATALIEKLTQDPNTGEPLMDREDGEDGEVGTPPTIEQAETYSEFCRTVYESLIKDVDRRGYIHEISFQAQDDAWDMCWRERTGIPLWKYKEIWDNLEDWEADVTLHPGDPYNRDPHVSEQQKQEYVRLRDEALAQNPNLEGNADVRGHATGGIHGKRKTSGLYGGNASSLLAMVRVMGAEYLDTYPGDELEDTGEHGPLHGNIQWILNERHPVDVEQLEWLQKQIRYRMEHQAMADRYLEIMRVPQPLGQACCNFDVRELIRQIQPRARYTALRAMIVARPLLFPYPYLERHGRPFDKGHEYLIAAFHYAELSFEQVERKLDACVEA
ncbi:MAG: hypothetical protein Q9224_005575, partial [Gallowayella concinna]